MKHFILFSLTKAIRLTLHLGMHCVTLSIGCFLMATPAFSQDILWGMTSSGGPGGSGTIFSIKTTGDDFTLIHAFGIDTANGLMPSNSLIEGSDGNFYGMTKKGGADNVGTIFKLNADGSAFSVIKSFYYPDDGAYPTGSLIETRDGYFYGTTHGGGGYCNDEYGYGTIFKIASDGSGFSVLQSHVGAHPSGSLVEGDDGGLYGMTAGEYGYNSFCNPYGGYGSVFKINVDRTSFTTLKDYGSGSAEGGYPSSNLIKGSDGKLYGMTRIGGNNGDGDGTIFTITLDGTDFRVLHSFNGVDGDYPLGSLIEGRDGYLYGMTTGRTYSNGTLFKIGADGTDFNVLKQFNADTDGDHPHGDLIEGSDGYFYGMASTGGDNGGGTIFKINADGSDFTVIKHFNPSTDGASPLGSLIIQKGKKPPLPTPTKINFQSKWPTPPQGWLKDYGLPFGEHSVADSSLTYGWKRRDNHQAIDLSVIGTFSGNPGNGRHRLSPSDILLATLMHMQGNDVKNFRGTPVESYWEMAVENGDYQVTVSVGDGSVYTYTDPEYHSINVEGIAAITQFIPQGTQGSMSRFKQATVQVTVADGYLTIDADGGRNTKINYAIIQPRSAPAVLASKQLSNETPNDANIIQAFPNPFSDKLTLDVKDYQGKVQVRIQDLTGNILYQTQRQIEANAIFLDLSQVKLKTGMYVIKLTAADGTSSARKVFKH